MPNMPNTAEDEEHARRLLTEHLATGGQSGFSCERTSPDPPDLLVDDGRRWGVEVTRTYLRVPKPIPTGDSAQRCQTPSSSSKLISSAGFTERLRKFGEALGQETTCIRKRDHTLSLGASPADSLGLSVRPNRFGKQWMKDAKTAILEHLRKDRTDTLRLPGGWLKPGDPGGRWTVAVHPGVREISVAACAMLDGAVTKKADDLPRWNSNFAQRWLLLLNHYPLVSDVNEVKVAIKTLLRKAPDDRRFDGVFWNAGTGSSLLAVASGRTESVGV